MNYRTSKKTFLSVCISMKYFNSAQRDEKNQRATTLDLLLKSKLTASIDACTAAT